MKSSRNQRASAGLAFLALSVSAWLAWLMLRESENSHQGKSIQHWCKVLWAGSPTEQTNAAAAIYTIGTNAFPALKRMVQAKDSRMRSAFLELCSKQSLVRYPYMDWAVDQQRIALKAIEALGEKAQPLVPFLQEVVQGWTNRSVDITYEASRIAAKFEPETTPQLVVKDGKWQLILPPSTGARE